MIIKDLEHMEKIVESNRSLSWDGWTVVSRYPSDKGRTSKAGVAVDSKWYIESRHEAERYGWNIPSKFVQ
jgi:hypothetical protein